MWFVLSCFRAMVSLNSLARVFGDLFFANFALKSPKEACWPSACSSLSRDLDQLYSYTHFPCCLLHISNLSQNNPLASPTAPCCPHLSPPHTRMRNKTVLPLPVLSGTRVTQPNPAHLSSNCCFSTPTALSLYTGSRMPFPAGHLLFPSAFPLADRFS